MTEEDGPVTSALEPLYQAAVMCLKHKLQLPALILLYAAIDIAGWCAADFSVRSVKASFTKFADRYVLPESGLECSALEIYGARCGILHTYTPDSELSAQGQVRIIAYAWGSASVEDLRESIRRMQKADMVAVHIDALFSSVRTGISRLDAELAASPTRADEVRAKLAKGFSGLSVEIVQLFLDGAQKHRGA